MLVMYLCNDDITTTTPGGRLPRGHINININIKAPRLLSGLPLSLRSAVGRNRPFAFTVPEFRAS